MKGAPDTPTGRLTTHVMNTVAARTDLPASTYNTVWGAVSDALNTAISAKAVVVEDNDWSFMAKVSALPMAKKRAFIKAAYALAETV